MIGHTFERLTVIAQSTSLKKRTRWKCCCTCGTIVIVTAHDLRSGNTRSCGCLHKEIIGSLNRTHGKSQTPECHAWYDMIHRCYNVRNKHYKDYGGRGIGVCDQWKTSVEIFLQDMGPKPSHRHTLERINNDGNYEQGNTRWATQKEQAANRRQRQSNTGCPGIYLIGRSYQATVKARYVGRFRTLEEAIVAQRKATA